MNKFESCFTKFSYTTKVIFKFSIYQYLLLIALISSNVNVYANENWSNYRAEFNELFKNKKYDEALKILEKVSDEQGQKSHSIKSLFYGAGVLSSGQDICRAIFNLEEVAELTDYGISRLGSYTTTLNYLYGGDWASIAALEGQPMALFIVAERIMNNLDKTSNPIYFSDTIKIYQDAYVYYYNSARLGFGQAKQLQSSLENIFETYLPDFDYKKLQTEINFKQILCPVRDVE